MSKKSFTRASSTYKMYIKNIVGRMIVYQRESKENDISWKGDGSRRIPRIITVDSTKNF